jgi:hypothetical protein
VSKHRLGVLFVHGMGEQPEGDTLLAFGEPVLQWIKGWLSRPQAGGPRGHIEVTATSLTPSRSNQLVPPHAEVRLVVENDGKPSVSSWVMAESWWGREVQRPAFGKLAGWMLTVGAWTILSHGMKSAVARKTTATRLTTEILALAVGLPLAIALQISVLFLSLLALVPIPSLRRALSGMLLILTGVLGDSYVLVESDLQRAAIVNRTRDALSWLAGTCEHVVVVAHSQGAAVAHHALRGSPPSNIRLLLTFGSGLGKLEELLRMKLSTEPVKVIARLIPLVFLSVALFGYILYEGADQLSELAAVFAAIMVLSAVVAVVLIARAHWETFDHWAKDLRLDARRPGLRWIDVYASHDPVPNGPLVPRGPAIGGLTSKPVVNLHSWLQDHTAYWRNRCEFVPCVVNSLDEVAGLHLFQPADVAALEDAAAVHHRRARWLVATRWATWLSAIIFICSFWGPLLEHGRVLRGMLQAMDSRIGTVLQGLETIILFALPFLSAERAADVGLRLLGAVIPLFLITVWRYGYRFVWRWWDDLAIERLFRPARKSGVADRAVVDFAVLTVGFAPLLVVGAAPYVGHVVVGHVVTGVLLFLYSLVAVFAIGWFAVGLRRLAARAWRDDPAARAELGQRLKIVGTTSLMVGFFFVVAMPALKAMREIAVAGLMGLIVGSALVWLHVQLCGRVRGMTGQVIVRHAAVFGPIAITLAASWVVIDTSLRTPSSEKVGDVILRVLTTCLGLYGIVLGLGHAVVSLMARLLRRGRRKPGQV